MQMPYVESVKVRYFVDASYQGKPFERRGGFAKIEKAREFRAFLVDRDIFGGRNCEARIVMRTITEREEIIE